MRFLKAQYFFTFAVFGCVLPYLSVFLADDRGLDDVEIGYILSFQGVAVLITPVLMTAMADLRVPARALIALMFTLAAIGLACLLGSDTVVLITAAHALFALAFAPITSLQDGLNFAVQRDRERRGLARVPYHRVRVWGTFGFMAPSIVIYLGLSAGGSISLVLIAGYLAAGLGAVSAFGLPALREPKDAGGALPTLDAARTLLAPRVLGFCVAMWILHLASSAYYAFYPLYLTETVGLAPKWVGLIATGGVAIEVFFMLGFGRMLRRFGLRKLMIVGAGAMVLRFGLMAVFVNAPVAIGTQVLHGIMVLAVHVAPPVYFNHHADDRFRHSIQGLYAMTVYGTGRIVGNVLAGYVAAVSLTTLMAYSAALSAAALILFAIALAHPAHRQVRA